MGTSEQINQGLQNADGELKAERPPFNCARDKPFPNAPTSFWTTSGLLTNPSSSDGSKK
jgi:hypothetical protein